MIYYYLLLQLQLLITLTLYYSLCDIFLFCWADDDYDDRR